jgi:hypothetical protein
MGSAPKTSANVEKTSDGGKSGSFLGLHKKKE